MSALTGASAQYKQWTMILSRTFPDSPCIPKASQSAARCLSLSTSLGRLGSKFISSVESELPLLYLKREGSLG